MTEDHRVANAGERGARSWLGEGGGKRCSSKERRDDECEASRVWCFHRDQ